MKQVEAKFSQTYMLLLADFGFGSGHQWSANRESAWSGTILVIIWAVGREKPLSVMLLKEDRVTEAIEEIVVI